MSTNTTQQALRHSMSYRRSRLSRSAGRFGMYLFLIILSAVTLIPTVYALFASFKPLDQLMSDGARLLPSTWQLSNYSEVWELGNFSRYFMNTVIIATVVVMFDIICSSMVGYVLARKRLRGLKAMETVFGATIFLGVGTITLYPKFMIALQLNLLNIWGIILVELAGIMVIHFFLTKAFCQSLSHEVYEASSIDGCSFFGTYAKIAFPMMRPILSTTAILAFQAAWNNFQVPYVFTMNNPDLRTLVVGVYALKSSGEGATSWHLMMAGTMLSLIPITLLFLFLQKYFMQGMSDGAVKG
ncbi:carbohydrate ABC transporter permease [Paenibacillus chungangensis]|uniref:Carbohydrate ABC transporter permease n=1 Tax=Paenibacillus chungangensis TaxID=696535 RepID=A0ABW3HKS5_9BACL